MKPLRSSYPTTHVCNPAFRWKSPNAVDEPTPEQLAGAVLMLQRHAERTNEKKEGKQ